MTPDLFKLIMKALVIGDKAQLLLVQRVLFERPIRRRRQDQVQ